jgi:NTP pyrophosphatase (non-canonical NTP hydrolase)
MSSEIEEIIKKLEEFREARDWKKFHDSKNLAIALSIEAGELNELFLWKNSKEADDNLDLESLKDELADVLSYAFLLASKHNLNIKEIIENKIQKNQHKYPIDKAKGNNTKYYKL